MSVLKAF